MNNYLKILVGSLLFGICQAYSMNQLDLIQILVSSLIPIVVVVVIACIYQLIRISMKLSNEFQDFNETIWKVFVPTIIVMFIVTVLSIYANFDNQKSKNKIDTFKDLVQQKSKNNTSING